MQSENPAATPMGPPTQQEMAQRIEKIKTAMVNRPLADAMKYLAEHPGELGGASAHPRQFLEDRGVSIPADFEVTIREGNSYTLCYLVNGVMICFVVG